jgi:hypothetical protein
MVQPELVVQLGVLVAKLELTNEKRSSFASVVVTFPVLTLVVAAAEPVLDAETWSSGFVVATPEYSKAAIEAYPGPEVQ